MNRQDEKEAFAWWNRMRRTAHRLRDSRLGLSPSSEQTNQEIIARANQYGAAFNPTPQELQLAKEITV